MFTIRFQGMMTHATIDGKQVIAIYCIDYPAHLPLLTVDAKKYAVDASEATQHPFKSGDLLCFRLHDKVEFGNLKKSTLDPADLPAVRRLSQICTGGKTPRKSVSTQMGDLDFGAYVILEAGKYQEEEFFDVKGRYEDEEAQCRVRTVTVTAEPQDSGKPITITLGAEEIKIGNNAEILITNSETNVTVKPPSVSTSRAAGKTHSSLQNVFFKEKDAVVKDLFPTSEPCTDHTIGILRAHCAKEADIHVDCTPTKYP